jgi:hypothetical protein
MSRGRLSDCSGSTTGKMEVRVLTHSQAVGSACERRESIACARKGSLRLLLCPGVRARARGENARRLARASSSPRLPSRSEQKRFTGCVMTEECPCSPREATLGASPRRRAAAGRGFFHPPAGTEADGGGAWRGAAARTRTHLFLRGRVPRERAGASRSRRSFGICSSEKKVRRRRSDARAEPLTPHKKKKKEKKTPLARLRRRRRTRLAFVAVRTETNHRLRNDRGMPVFTPGSNPRCLPAAAYRRGSCVCIDHPATFRKTNCRCSFRGSSAWRTSRPRRGASLKCGPLSKRAPIAGVLRPLLQVTFCERAANETRVAFR